ncbi:glycosyltransferase [Marinobacter sp. DUT-1]|uniref:glycosyltransferase n=1 Tax=Marinobacter sp. DUT-1 TaxID=3412037 RepID=UPI003D16F85B
MELKVLHLIDSGGLYGAERMLLALVETQRAQGLDAVILSAGEPNQEVKPLEDEARRLGLPVKSWRMSPGFNVSESWRILKWAHSNGYDILHSHGFKFNVLIGSYPIKIRKIPMVTTLHGYVHAKKFRKIWLYEALDRYAIRFLQGIVLVGEAMTKQLPVAVSNNENVVVIPNGLDIKGVAARASQPIENDIQEFISDHFPIILGVGRLSEEKGFDRLIEAFQGVCINYENPGLLIVGEGKQKKKFQLRVKELGMQDRVLMPGYCKNVPALQRMSDLLVIPSLTEGLPITLLEAMAVGVPVLVSPVGEMPAVIGEGRGGYLLPEHCDSDELAICILSALEDPERNAKKDWSLKSVTTSYSVEAMEARYRELYHGMLAEKWW